MEARQAPRRRHATAPNNHYEIVPLKAQELHNHLDFNKGSIPYRVSFPLK
jgi:hypothetical protein